MNKGNLYLIPTPIGNLNDVSSRIKDTISLCDFIACEDTRNSSKLLSLLGVKKQCISCHEHNEASSSENIIKLLNEGKNIGYMSDAGYPCISDPGCILVEKAIKEDIRIIPIPGPSAFIEALVASGLSTEHFYFYGFLSSKESDRLKELKSLRSFHETIIFYESPHRIQNTLKNLYSVFGNRKIVVARELTKLHEEFIRTTLEDLISNPKEIIGEIVLVVEGNSTTSEIDEQLIIDQVNTLIKNGINKKDAILSVSLLFNYPKNLIKKLFL